MTTMDERVERRNRIADALIRKWNVLFPSFRLGKEDAMFLALATIETDDSALAQRLETARKKAIVANAELRDVEKSNDALAQENRRMLRMISGMENEDPELVERWRANTKDKPHDK